jgi:hypothetical protein
MEAFGDVIASTKRELDSATARRRFTRCDYNKLQNFNDATKWLMRKVDFVSRPLAKCITRGSFWQITHELGVCGLNFGRTDGPIVATGGNREGQKLERDM